MCTTTVCYCPVKKGIITTSISANGRGGVWRLIHFDLYCSDAKVYESVQSEIPTFQPESFDFIIMALKVGRYFFTDLKQCIKMVLSHTSYRRWMFHS